MTAEPDLLPCPFCGGTEIYTVPMEHPSVGEYWMVGCNNSDCPMDTDRVKIEGGTLEKAAAIWNTRATDANVAPLQAENERLRVEVETWKGIVHDEIAANTAFREAGGAKPDEDMPTFCARILAEVRENRSRKLALAVKYVVHKNRAERLAEVLGRILENEASDWKAAEEFGGYVLDDELREEARDVLRREGWK